MNHHLQFAIVISDEVVLFGIIAVVLVIIKNVAMIMYGLNREKLQEANDKSVIAKHPRTVETDAGDFVLRALDGYYGDKALFLYAPIGVGFSAEIANAFYEASDGMFLLEPAPGNSQGGDSLADGIISAGHDPERVVGGVKRYFKTAGQQPDIAEVASWIQGVVKASGRYTR